MCRICGRMIRCVLESMPSRIPSTSTRLLSSTSRIQPAKNTLNQKRGLTSLSQNSPSAIRQTTKDVQTVTLPLRAKLHQGATTQQATLSPTSNNESLPPSLLRGSLDVSPTEPETDLLSQTPVHSKPLVISKSLQSLLPALCAQLPHYITAHIHRFPYLLQTGDTLRLPFHMKGVSAGDVLRLNRASVLGSRDFTLKAGTSSTETYDNKRTGEPNYLDERLFEVRARVMGVDSGPMFVQEKTKRRNRRVKTVKSKHKYTILKIMQVRVRTLDELMKEKGTMLLES